MLLVFLSLLSINTLKGRYNGIPYIGNQEGPVEHAHSHSVYLPDIPTRALSSYQPESAYVAKVTITILTECVEVNSVIAKYYADLPL